MHTPSLSPVPQAGRRRGAHSPCSLAPIRPPMGARKSGRLFAARRSAASVLRGCYFGGAALPLLVTAVTAALAPRKRTARRTVRACYRSLAARASLVTKQNLFPLSLSLSLSLSLLPPWLFGSRLIEQKIGACVPLAGVGERPLLSKPCRSRAGSRNF